LSQAGTGSDDLAAQIVARCRERIERGETVDREAILRAHPDLADTLREQFDSMRMLENAFGMGASQDESPSLCGRRLGPYRLASMLGAGGMGTVYLATVESAAAGLAPGARVAVKVIHPHHLARPESFRRFLREAELGRRVRHPNVVRTLDADEHVEASGRIRFLVLEYVEGRTLRALLDELGRVPEALCRHVGREIARALAAIHAAGAVHRDLKPDNVLVTREHLVKVMDLGVARAGDEAMRLSHSAAFVGSVRYAAPEQFRGRGEEVDGRADLYALGLTLHELATGLHPFDDDDFATVLRRQMEEVPPRAGTLNPQLSPFFEELLTRLLPKDRSDRIASAEELATILGEGEESAWWKDRALSMRRETRRPLRRVRVPRETALHGRDAEMAALSALFERAKAGDGQVVLVEGEAGIGKSRLVDEFVLSLRAAGEDVDFLFGSYPPGGAATAAGAFTSAYREHIGDDESGVREAIPQTPLLVPAFAALLRGDATPAGAEPLTKDSLSTVFVHATRTFAARRTTVVFIDDLHFAPEAGRALFASLALAAAGHRILLVGGARPSLEEKWLAGVARLPHLTRLPLRRLGPKELVRLLHDALKSQHLAEELAGKVGTKSDGNPFFVFEILRGLREGRFLTRRPDGAWATTSAIREIQVPSSIVDVVQARVSDLAPEDRDALEVASCVGFEFDAALVGDVLGVARIPLLQRLGRIEKSHRLIRSAGRRFVFDHHQVMEVLHDGLSDALREEYHAAIGEALETQSGAAARAPGESDGALCVDLADHLLRGGRGARAMRYLDRALAHLEQNYRNEAAARLLERALAVPGLVSGGARSRRLRQLALRLQHLGRLSAEEAPLSEALALADAEDDPRECANVRIQLGWFLVRAGRSADAEQVIRAAVAFASRAGDLVAEARATGNLGSALMYLRRLDEAQESLERQHVLAVRAGDLRAECTALCDLAVVSHWRGRVAEARDLSARSVDRAVKLGDRRLETHTKVNLAAIEADLGRCETALESTRAALVVARDVGSRADEARATANLAELLRRVGRTAEALDVYPRARDFARDVGIRELEHMIAAGVGMTRAKLGELEAARRHLDDAIDGFRSMGRRDREGAALSMLAIVLRDGGDDAGAEAALRLALPSLRDAGSREGVADALMSLGSIAAAQGRVADATTSFDEAAAAWTELGATGPLALLAAERLALPGASAAEAMALVDQHGENIDAWETLRVRFLLWRATGDAAQLDRAARLLERLVADAPRSCRASMLSDVAFHREIAAAASEHGVPLAVAP
jgi:serine/threonine protein kinase/tetratricopeptide (TPR) repeat protein